MTSRLRSLFKFTKKGEKNTASVKNLSESETDSLPKTKVTVRKNSSEGKTTFPFILNGETRFNYKPFDRKYIVSFLGKYDKSITPIVEKIFDTIFPFYSQNKLRYSNVCGANSTFICAKTKFPANFKMKKLQIYDDFWDKDLIYNESILTYIKSIFGPGLLTIGASYHALAHIEIDKAYFIAVETTICEPYKLQFYVGKTEEELKEIIKARYLCTDYFVTQCDEWLDLWTGERETRPISEGGRTKRRKLMKRKRTIKKMRRVRKNYKKK